MNELCDVDLSREKPAGRKWFLVVCAITVVAAIVKLYGIADWPARGDETYTVRDGLCFFENLRKGASYTHTYPAYHFLVWALFKVTGSASVFVARLPAFVFGVATFPLFWFYGRRAFGRHIAVVALVIIALTEWHIFHSKIARYYSAVFLFGGLSMLLLYSAVWEKRPRRALAALILGILAAAFHPSGMFVVVGGASYLCLLLLFRPLRPAHPMGKVAAWYLVPLAALAVPGVLMVLRLLGGWSSKGPQWNYTPGHMLLGLVRTVGFTVALAAFAGAFVCAFKRARLCVFLVSAVLPGVGALMVLSPFADVRPDFAFSVMPACFFLAAALCVVPFENQKPGLGRGTCIASLAMLVAFSQLPATVSHFTEKEMDDPRIPAKFVREMAKPGDKFMVYMTGVEEYLGHPTYRLAQGYMYSPLADWEKDLKAVQEADHRTWFILSFPRVGLPKALNEWLSSHAQLVKRWRAKRFDYLTMDIEVWLFDPKWQERTIESLGPVPAAPQKGAQPESN